MEIKAKVVIKKEQGHLNIAMYRNEDIRPFLEDKIPLLKDWYLGTINAKVISPTDLTIKTIRTTDAKYVYVPQIASYIHGKPYLFHPEVMRLIPIKFTISDKVSATDGFLYIPSGSPHPQDGIIELITKEKLCDKFGVIDGDRIIISVN